MIDTLATFATSGPPWPARWASKASWRPGESAWRGGHVEGTHREREPAGGEMTTQLCAIAEVATAVTQGDLTRSITVEALGEVAALKVRSTEIRNLRDTTQRTPSRTGSGQPREVQPHAAGPKDSTPSPGSSSPSLHRWCRPAWGVLCARRQSHQPQLTCSRATAARVKARWARASGWAKASSASARSRGRRCSSPTCRSTI